MSDANPIDLLFRGMEKLAPGSNSDTLKVFDMLPEASHRLIVNAGCGAGRHTLTLAERLHSLVHAIDSYELFLVSLQHRVFSRPQDVASRRKVTRICGCQ